MVNSTLLNAGTLFGALATLSWANPMNSVQLPKDPSPTVLVAQVPSQVTQGEQKPVPTTTVPTQPTTSSAVTQKPPTEVITKSSDATSQLFLNSLTELNNILTQGSEKARRLQNQVPGN